MGEAVHRGCGGTGRGVTIAVRRGNRLVGGAGAGLEERTVQANFFAGVFTGHTDQTCQGVLISCLSHLHASGSLMMAFLYCLSEEYLDW